MSRNIHDHAEQLQRDGLYLPSRTIFIWDEGSGDGVDTDMSRKAVMNIHVLDNTGTGDITIFLNSAGGETDQGWAIYDAIKQCRNHVKVIVMGKAASMGSIILQAADERIMGPNAYLMIHEGTEAHPDSHPKTIEAWHKYWREEAKKTREILLERIKKKKPRFTLEQLEKHLIHDSIFNAKETIEMGLADKVLE